MTAAVYLRFSLDRTGEELGIERHRPDCHGLARRRGWDTVEFVDNDTSATTGGPRPGYEAMMAEVAAGRISQIVVWQTSRLWRNRRERAEGIEILRRAHVSVVAVKGPEFDMTTAYGRGMAGMVGEFDTMEVEVKSERQVREAQQRAERGEPNGGRRAFGYLPGGRELDPTEAPAGERAYRSLLTGRSLSGIGDDLNAAGHTTTMGGPWRHNSVRNFLLNPRNAGLRSYRGVVVGKAVWPAMVDEDVWRSVVTLLGMPDRRTNYAGSGLKHLGTGLYLCGRPGCGELVRSTYRERYADGRPKRIYKCPACHLSRTADPVDEYVCEVVDERFSRPNITSLLAKPAKDRTGELRTEAMALRTRRKSLAALVADGTLTDMEVRREAARLAERLAEIEVQLSASHGDGPLAAIVLAPNPVAAWRVTAGQTDRRQVIVNGLMTVTLLSPPLGRRKFDPETVDIVWKR